MHRRGSCVVGLTGEDEFHASLSDECIDDSKREILALEHRALFDMELKVGEGIVRQDRRWKLRGVESVGLNCRLNSNAISIGVRQRLRIEFADKSEATEEGFAEAHTFFFRKADDF